MKAIKSRIQKIRKELDAIESPADVLKKEQPDAQAQIDWLVQNMQFVIADVERVENASGKGKSYATLARNNRSQLKATIRALEIWQQTGNAPEF